MHIMCLIVCLNEIFVCLTKQPLDHFVVMENIWLEGAPGGVVLLGRDTRPSGKTLLEAAKQVLLCFVVTLFS